MPFLRAALLKKNLTPVPEQPQIQLTPLIEESSEPEEDFPPAKIEELHRLIDTRTHESEPEPEPEPEQEPLILIVQEEPPQPEPETVIELEPEAVVEILPEPEAAIEAEPEPEPVELVELEPEQEVEIIDEPEPEILEPLPETTGEPEPVITETEEPKADLFDENSLLDEPETEHQEQIELLPDEQPEAESESEPVPEESESESESETKSEDFALKYDFTSGERYVDKVSTKTEFDKMLDELAGISKELLSWQTEKFARDFTSRFQEETQAEARKYEAFLGGYITNAAMLLYDKGYRDNALKQLEQAKSILEARKKLEDETSAIKSRVEEQNDAVDLSDILGLFGDG